MGNILGQSKNSDVHEILVNLVIQKIGGRQKMIYSHSSERQDIGKFGAVDKSDIFRKLGENRDIEKIRETRNS